MDNEMLTKIIERVLRRQFRSRQELADWLGVHNSYISRLFRAAVQRGLVDPKDWQSSFRTGLRGHRGRNKNPRTKSYGRTAVKVKAALALKESEQAA